MRGPRFHASLALSSSPGAGGGAAVWQLLRNATADTPTTSPSQLMGIAYALAAGLLRIEEICASNSQALQAVPAYSPMSHVQPLYASKA